MEHIHNTFTVACEKSKMFFFSSSSIMKNIVVLSFTYQSQFRFPANYLVVLLLDYNQVLVVYLNLLLSFYSNC